MAQPVVWYLMLPTILNGLLKHAVLVTKTMAHSRKLQGRHRIQKAGGQATKSAIAQTRVRFFL